MDPTVFENYYNSASFFLSVILLVTAIALCLFGTNLTLRKNRKGKTNLVPKYRHFHLLEVPILEGFCSLHQLWKDGSNAATKWASINNGGIGCELYIGPLKTILLTDASACHKLLNSSEPGHLGKPQDVYSRIFVGLTRNGLLSSEYDLWKRHRKVVARSFTYRALQSNHKIADGYGKKFAKVCLEISENNKGIVQGKHLFNNLSLFLLARIVELCIGSGFQTAECISKFLEDFNKVKSLVAYRFLHPELFIAPIWWLHPKRRETNRLTESMRTFMIQVISWYENDIEDADADSGKLEYGEDKCLVESMLNHGVSREEICAEVGTVLEAGFETTDRAIGFLLFDLALNLDVQVIRTHSHNQTYSDNEQRIPLIGNIKEACLKGIDELHRKGTIWRELEENGYIYFLNFCQNPLLYVANFSAKCREEVDSLFESKSLSSDFDFDLNMDALSELKYLERCVLESLRLTPTLPFFMRQLDTPLQINENTTIDKGYNVLISPWVIHRDSRYYPNPLKFDPDRFLPENVKKREPGTFIPFSGGPRNCIGYKSGLNQIKVMMTWIIRNFEISTTDARDDVKILFEISTIPERHYNITLKNRKFS